MSTELKEKYWKMARVFSFLKGPFKPSDALESVIKKMRHRSLCFS